MTHEPRQKLSETTITLKELLNLGGLIGGIITALFVLGSLVFVNWPVFNKHEKGNAQTKNAVGILQTDQEEIRPVITEMQNYLNRHPEKKKARAE
jgi:predicted negative regulator of RcsB-dependent stress response